MLSIRPISDLRNKFSDIENAVNDGNPVFLTKNGYCAMVVMSIETYSRMCKNAEQALDEADEYTASNTERMTHKDVFRKLRKQINE